MYNIHNHYYNIYKFSKSINTYISLLYLHPFGATQSENLEVLGDPHPGDEYDIPLISEPLARHGPVLICYDQEPLIPGFNRDLFKFVSDNLKVNQLHLNDRRGILISTERDSDAKDQLINEFGLIDCNYFHHAFTAADWYRGYKYLHDLLPVKDRKLSKKFITFNRITSNARVYRSLLVNELISHGILNQGNVSFSINCPDGAKFDDELRKNCAAYKIPASLVTETISNINGANNVFRIDFVDTEYIPNSSFEINAIPENMESFLHIVTETCYWGRKKHLTEKIFKPIVMRQPFVLVGCAHNLEYLKSYGFKTFDRWWDESYDQIEDDIERMHAIGKVLADICKNDLDTLTMMLHDMDEVLEHNYQRFYSPEFLEDCWKELTDQLKVAVKHKPLMNRPLLYIDPQTDRHLHGR